MLRECVSRGRGVQQVVVLVEPIALYMTRDLHSEGDGLWTSVYEAPGDGAPFRLGDAGVHGNGTDLANVTYGNGYYLSRHHETRLAADRVNMRVIDLRWPGPDAAVELLEAVRAAQISEVWRVDKDLVSMCRSR